MSPFFMHPLYTKAAPLTQVAIDSAIEVQNHLGVGLLESVYQKCLMRELGLVLNFGNPQLRHGRRGIARVILKGADSEEVPF